MLLSSINFDLLLYEKDLSQNLWNSDSFHELLVFCEILEVHDKSTSAQMSMIRIQMILIGLCV